MANSDKPGRDPLGENSKRNLNKERKAPQRSSRAALVWLMLFLALTSLLLFKGYGPTQTADFSQSEFERKLADKAIVSVELTYENGDVMVGEGVFRQPLSTVKPSANTPSQSPQPTSGDTRMSSGTHFKTRVVYTNDLAKLLQLSEANVVIKPNNSGFWNFILIGILPLVLLIAFIYFFSMRQMRSSGRGAMDFGRSKARMIPPDELNVHFDDIAGADEAKEEIREIVDYLKDPLRYQLVGGQIPKGCLVVGEPGTGKTLIAKAVACEAGVPFFSISGSDFVEMFVGVGASRVRDMFDQARKNMPCLIFIDEIDAVGRSRFSGWGGGHDEREQTLNAMLVEMDGLESRNGVIVLAATNRPDVLDPALLRPGRFDRQVVMDLPDIVGRRQILDVHVKKIKVDSSVDLDVMARTTPGFSGADLANLCNEAALLAARYNREAVTQSDMEEARDKVSYGRERRSRRITERERKLTAYHEAGHALVALHNPHATPLHKVTIIPRGQAYLGATFSMPKEDSYTRSKLELQADMEMSMGGRAAEEIIIGDVTTGAASDINHVTHIARLMVCMYGMSDKLGAIKYGNFPAHPHMPFDASPEETVSPETAREVDLEIRRLSQNAMQSARDCLTKYRDELEKLAQALLKRETMSIDEINELLGYEKNPADSECPEQTLRPSEDDESAGESL
jgi:cell division protease FtsH